MAGLFDGDPTGGLMAAFANPQTAGLLGMAGGLLQAAGPSRIPVSMGQALGAGLQGMGQGVGNAFQTQQQLLRMRAMQGLMGGDTGQPSAQPQSAPSYSSMFGPASTAPGTMAESAPQAPATPHQASPGIYGRSPQQLFQQGMLMNMAGIQGGGDMMRIAVEHDPSLAAMMPTDITKMGVQGGMSPADIQAANAAGVAKANYIPPVNARPGAILRNPLTMQPMAFNPNIPAGGTPVFDASGNVVGINQIPGATDITSAMAAAKTAGEGSALPFTEGKDAAGNPLPIMSRTAAATQGAGVPGFTPFQNAIRQVETNGNMNAVNPASGAVGSMQVTKTGAGSPNPGFGVRPAANNSPIELQRVGADYAGAMQQHYGNDTDAAVAYNWGPQNADKWIAAGRPWKMLPPETRNYVGQVHAQMQNFSGNGQGAQPQSGAIYAAAPMGATTAANASQGAPSKQMADAYGSLSNGDANYQQSREALQQMMAIARNQGMGGTAMRMLPQDVATRLSADAAEYQKAHANYVSLQGKALGGGGTDASRATINESVPTYDKPQDAKIAGLTNQLNQLDQAHLKTQFLTPLYTQGNEKAYTQQSAAFDQNIKPSMMPILQMSGDQQRAAVQAAVKANPSLRANFEWAFNNGMLK
jgi:hypothetical protein